MNKLVLIGRVGGDPVIKEVGQSTVCKFSLATSESYTKNGEKVTETEWHNLVFWGKQCEVLQKWVHKGDLFSATGKVKTRKYEDKEGVTHYATEVICNEFEFISSGKKQDEGIKPSDAKKTTVKSMSNIEDLPGYVDSEVPGDDEPPFA
jgi:single-strand DNA-binding protein